MAAGPSLSDRGLPEAATRRDLPPFSDEHGQLRESIRRFVDTELRPHAKEWEDGAGSPTRCSRGWPSSASWA